ncbi:MAG: TlpA family protein disulfide reductase [Betaproteobacteria bacterium]|nr:TlpA family protein disulfide reductase [Betaproteobacteria bacterium]
MVLACLFSFGVQAEGFTLKDAGGQIHRLSDYRGKWVLVNFWATWCPPCVEEIPDLVSLYEARKGRDMMVIGIAMDDQDRKTVLEFAETMFITYPVVLGDPKIASQIGVVRGLPTTYLYDPCGKLATYRVGALTRQSVERFIRQAKSCNAGSRPEAANVPGSLRTGR